MTRSRAVKISARAPLRRIISKDRRNVSGPVEHTQNQRRIPLSIIHEDIWIAGEHQKPDRFASKPRAGGRNKRMLSNPLRRPHHRIAQTLGGGSVVLRNPADGFEKVMAG